MTSARVVALVVAVVLSGEPAQVSAHPPPFWWMADMSATSRAGIELTAGQAEDGIVDQQVLSASLFAQFAINSTLSVHGRFPLTWVRFDLPVFDSESEAAIGNLSLGLQGTSRRPSGRSARTLLGAGVVLYLPTASNDTIADFEAARATAAFAVPDPARWRPNTTAVRLRGDTRFESDALFFQAEAAVDVFIADNDDDAADLTIGFGPGVAVSPNLAVLAEFSVASVFDDPVFFTADLGLRYHSRTTMFGFRLYLPISDELRDRDVLGFGLDFAGRF
jgi:hypothetical protein